MHQSGAINTYRPHQSGASIMTQLKRFTRYTAILVSLYFLAQLYMSIDSIITKAGG
jgi:hypothetical protein